MLSVVIGIVLGAIFFTWAFDLYQPEEIAERGERGQFLSAKEKLGCLVWLLGAMLLVILLLSEAGG